MIDDSVLFSYWKWARRFPAWLAAFIWTPEEEACFEEWEDKRSRFAKAGEAYWRDAFYQLKRPEPESTQWVTDRRKEYLESQIETLKKNLLGIRLEIGRAARSRQQGTGVIELMNEDRAKEAEEKLQRYESELKRLEGPVSENRRTITGDMIAKAKAVPIRNLIGTDKDTISCPLHEDKRPSMKVNEDFVYCFSCGKSMDSIGWLMKVEGYSFPAAVRRLEGSSNG